MLHLVLMVHQHSVGGCNQCGLACGDVTVSTEVQSAGGIIGFPAR